jgi:hypothetical protein
MTARHILRTDGLVSLISRGFKFLGGWFFERETYYLYRHEMKDRNEAEFMPRIQDFTFEIVFTNKQADELATRSLEFRSSDGIDRYRLDEGAIAFCFFVEQELAHKGWIAVNEEAQRSFFNIPYEVDYLRKEAFCGGTFTNPKYRGNGLMTYGYFKRLQFLKESGRTEAKNAVAKDNIASHKALAKLEPELYGQARYLKVVGLKFWREIPLPAKPL